MTLPFTGIATFAKVPLYDLWDSRVPHAAVLGIPTDEGTTQHPGARYGPRAIREASTQFPYYKRGRGYYDPERDRPMLAELELRDAADVEIVPTALAENAERIAESVTGLRRRGVFPVCLGGDHSVTPAILAAFADTPVHLATAAPSQKLSMDVTTTKAHTLTPLSLPGYISRVGSNPIGQSRRLARKELGVTIAFDSTVGVVDCEPV